MLASGVAAHIQGVDGLGDGVLRHQELARLDVDAETTVGKASSGVLHHVELLLELFALKTFTRAGGYAQPIRCVAPQWLRGTTGSGMCLAASIVIP